MFRRFMAGAAALASCGLLQAAAIGTLTFTEPTGTIGPLDSADVNVMFTLDAGSVPLTVVNSEVTSGYTLSDVQDNEFSDAMSNPGVDLARDRLSASVNEAFYCQNISSGTPFTSSCIQGPPYDFAFADARKGGVTDVLGTGVALNPGDSATFFFGTFAPAGGNSVAPGTYTFDGAAVFINVFDETVLDSNGQPLALAFIPIARTSDSGSVFTRTVVSQTPEPAAFAMLLSGMGALALFARRRRRA